MASNYLGLEQSTVTFYERCLVACLAAAISSIQSLRVSQVRREGKRLSWTKLTCPAWTAETWLVELVNLQ